MRRILSLAVILSILGLVGPSLARPESKQVKIRHVKGSKSAIELPAGPKFLYSESPVHWFGFYDELTGEAVEGETWTFDHCAPDPFEGWLSEDVTASDYIAWRRITDSIWTGHDNPISAPILEGAASFWLGRFEDEADSMCWATGLGYGNDWDQQRLVSPSLTYDGSDSVRISFLYFCDSESLYDHTSVIVDFPDLVIQDTLAIFSGRHGTPSEPQLYSQQVDIDSITGGQASSFSIIFEFNSDGSWSDEGVFVYDCIWGPFCVDSISVSGGIVEGDQLYDFESGDQGFVTWAFPGFGDFFGVNDLSIYPIGDTTGCSTEGNVLSCHDEDFGRPRDMWVEILSPSVALSSLGPGPFTIFADAGFYTYLPLLAQCDFYSWGWKYYPYPCAANGESVWSPTIWAHEAHWDTSGCMSRRMLGRYPAENIEYVTADADSARFVLMVMNMCRIWDGVFCDCEESPNFSPLFDNIRVGVVPGDVLLVPSYRFPTIQAAIDSASAGDSILVARGRYAPPATGEAFTIVMKSGVSLISESGPAATIIDAESSGRVFTCDSADSTTLIQGFTIRGGYASGDPPESYGGGMYMSSSSIRITDCVFTQNAALSDTGEACGGGLYVTAGSPLVSGCVFTNNSAESFSTAGGFGGGMMSDGTSSPRVVNCEFSVNQADSGGGLCVLGPGSEVLGCTFTENTAWSGGGLMCGAQILIEGCSFYENFAPEVGGGGLLSSGSPTVRYCTFAWNSASTYGGGGLFRQGEPEVFGCTFTENSADLGGGIAFMDTAFATVENTIIAFSTMGEAVHCDETSSAVLSCCDVYNNSGGDWTGCIAVWQYLFGNISLDPIFCDAGIGDFTIRDDSPCTPENSPPECEDLIGAQGVGCSVGGVGERVGAETLFLGPAVPNPFRPVTEFSYCIPATRGLSRVSVKVYDVLGRQVRTLVGAEQVPGTYRVTWDGTDENDGSVASGIYFCRLTWNGQSKTRRIVLIR